MGKRTPVPQFVPVPIHGGLDYKSDTRQVAPPNVLGQDNFSNKNAGALSPRPGTTPLAVFGQQDGATVGATNEELVGLDNANLYNYNPTSAMWSRRGEYTDMSVGIQNVLAQAVNQNYTQGQLGGVRNISVDYVGNIGVMAWDTGVGTATGGDKNVTGGYVYLCCFDGITGKVYWTTRTLGFCAPYTNSPQNYQLQGRGANNFTALNPGAATGATQPLVVAYRGVFMFGMVTCSQGTMTPVFQGGKYWYQINLMFFTPNGTTGIPPQPTIASNSLTNATQVIGASGFPVPFNCVAAGSNGYWNYGSAALEYTNNYFDMSQNGTYFALAASMASVENGSPPTMTAVANIYAMSTSSAPGIIGAYVQNNTNAMPTAPTGSNGAQPLSIATTAGNGYAAIATQNGALALALSNCQMGSPVAYDGLQDNANPNVNGLFSWPAAVGILGTSTSYTVTITNGYLTNTFSGNQLVLSGRVTSYVNVPMTSTRQLPSPALGGTYGEYQSTVASKIFYLPSASSPLNSGVVDPCVWLYAASPSTTSSSGFNSFTNLYLVRLNVAPYSANLPNQISEIIARAMYLRVLPVRYGTLRPAAVVTPPTGGYAVAAMQLGNVADNIVGMKIVSTKYATQQRTIVPLPQGALLTGADTRYYDGTTVRSAGWQRLPEVGLIQAVLNSSSGLKAFQYTYIFVYVEYDAYGNAIYSSPSPPYLVPGVTSASPLFQVNITTTDVWPATTKGNTLPAALHVYRNTSLNPLQYYRAAVLTEPQTLSYGSDTYVDIGPDDISGNALLYSPPNGGELSNDSVPPSTCAVATKQRVYVASAENPSYVYPSKPFYAGRAPIEFNAAQYVDIDPSTGPIVGLAALDSTVVVFKSKAIYLLSGDGPDATGAGSFNTPYRLTTDVGLKDPNSIVSTEQGIFFRSQRGYELLDRGGASVSYIGMPLDNYVSASSVTTSAVVVPSQSQVRFFYSSAFAHVYDYVLKAWSRFYYQYTNPGNLTAVNFKNTVYMGMPNATTNASLVLQENDLTSSNFLDNTNAVPQVLRTGWIRMTDLHGWGRVRRVNILGLCQNTCTMTVQFAYDYNNGTTTPAVSMTVASGQFQIRVRTTRQLCQAVSVLINVTPLGSGAGLQISQLELETSVKSGALRKPDTVSY